MLFNDMQFPKVKLSIVLTEDGISIYDRDAQYEKAYFPMKVNEEGSFILTNE